MCGSTCFGRPHSHHQELNNCSSSLWFYRRSVVIAVLDAVNVQQQHVQQPSTYAKPEPASAVLDSWWLGGVSPETRWASYKYEIKFWYTVASCWIFFMNYTAMHGSTNIRDQSSTLVEVYRRYVAFVYLYETVHRHVTEGSNFIYILWMTSCLFYCQ
jgi:hypothetical protein